MRQSSATAVAAARTAGQSATTASRAVSYTHLGTVLDRRASALAEMTDDVKVDAKAIGNNPYLQTLADGQQMQAIAVGVGLQEFRCV